MKSILSKHSEFGILPIGLILILLAFLFTSDFSLDFKPNQFTASLGSGKKAISITSLGAAQHLCKNQASINYRSRLFQTHIDDHSSRFDDNRDLYLVMMLVSIGTAADHYQYRVHCRVQYKDNQVDYFKAVLVS